MRCFVRWVCRGWIGICGRSGARTVRACFGIRLRCGIRGARTAIEPEGLRLGGQLSREGCLESKVDRLSSGDPPIPMLVLYPEAFCILVGDSIP